MQPAAHVLAPADANATLFCYSGRMSESAIAVSGESLRARLAARRVEAGKARKIFSTYVELAYNVVHYGHPESTARTQDIRLASINVTSCEEGYSVICRSRISNDDARRLSARIEQLRSMSNEEIKFAYRLRLTNLQYEGESGSSKGAGLGLITVARNAIRPLEYSIFWDDSGPDSCFFNIHATL